MSSTPSSIPPVRLDDLAAPRFSPEIAEMFAGAAALVPLLPMEFDALHDAAVEQLGGTLTDFGTHEYVEPMRVLLHALTTEAGLSGIGHVSVHTQLVGFLKNRLLLADLLARHPEIHDLPVRAPIVIAGQPRTGTTHLHNLLAADPALRTLPYWESQQPVPIPAEFGIDPDPRLERCAVGLAMGEQAMPYFNRMHEMTVEHVHEEIQLLANSFCTMYFDTIAPMPSWREFYRHHDHVPHYEYLRTTLQALTFLRGGDRWLLKSPQHLEQLRTLRTVFPDATVLVTHRDPVPVTISLVTMLAYTARLHLDPIDPVRVAHYWAEVNGEMLDAVQRDREVWPADQSLDVRFHEFMADDIATVERIYALADQPLDERARRAHADYLAHHERDRHGKVVYEFEPFGLEPGALRTRFEPYVERFGIVREWTPRQS